MRPRWFLTSGGFFSSGRLRRSPGPKRMAEKPDRRATAAREKVKSRKSKPNGKTAQQLCDHGLERNPRHPGRQIRSQMEHLDPASRPVLVLDFGAQYVQLIARRVRERHAFARIVRHDITPDRVRELNPLALILSGGPMSVYEPGAPHCDPALFGM